MRTRITLAHFRAVSAYQPRAHVMWRIVARIRQRQLAKLIVRMSGHLSCACVCVSHTGAAQNKHVVVRYRLSAGLANT